MNSEEVAELRDAAEATDTMASVVHSRLFQPPVQEALRRVKKGEIGEVVSVDHLYGRNNDLEETMRGDWIYDMVGAGIGEGLPHRIYLPLAFVDRLGEVTGISYRNRAGYNSTDFDGLDIEAIDNLGDCMISIKRMSHSTTQDLLFIHGTEGILTVDLVKQGVFMKNTTTGISAGAFVNEHLDVMKQLVQNIVAN